MSRDPHSLETYKQLDHRIVRDYLVARGWRCVEVLGASGSLWTWPHTPEQDAVLSTRPDAPEYAQRMAELVRALARAEGRPVEKMLEALDDATLDVVRVRLGGADELPLKQGIEAIDALPKLIQAAALAERSPRAHYASRLPDKVSAYLETLRLKQTERGSFVLRLASPLGAPDEQGSYGRRVITQLARSLHSAALAAEAATHIRSLNALEEAVPHGVSANLLDALAAFGEACEDRFTVELDWASALAAPELPRSVTFERIWTPTMRQAAASFRKQPAGPRPATITGLVRRLDELRASEGDTPRLGKIGLWATIDGKLRQVEVELAGPDYQIAVSAHEVEALINVSGTLDQQQRKWVLLGAHGVERWREQDDE